MTQAMVSILSRIEALGFSQITNEEKATLESVLEELPESGLTEVIANRAIALRQKRKLGLADAVIAATALVHDVPPLVTRNADDFKNIEGLHVINPFAISMSGKAGDSGA